MRSLLQGLVACLLLGLVGLARAQAELAPTAPQEAIPRISLLTFAPGEVYWQRFGHNALMVEPNDGGAAVVYNYGIFDFHQKNFFLNFARGHMLYRLAAIPVPNTLAEYAAEGRWVYLQELALSPAQAGALAKALADNALPQNAEYRYDYFRANCSTQVRDMLDRALGGELKRQWQSVDTGSSFRREAIRLISPARPLMLGMDAVMGPAGDAPISLWEQAYVPEVVMQSVRSLRIDGHPLVAREGYWLPPGGGPETPKQAPDFAGAALVLGLVLAALLIVSSLLRDHAAARGAYGALALPLTLISGLGGLILLMAWTLTEHWAIAANANLLLFSPLSLLLLPAATLSLGSGWRPKRRARIVALLIAAFALLSLPLHLLPGAQQNLPWVLFWLPVHLALAWSFRRAGRAPAVDLRL